LPTAIKNNTESKACSLSRSKKRAIRRLSFWAQLWAYEQEAKNCGERSVLVVLGYFADLQGLCFPGQTRIATMTCLDERTIRRHLAAWEERGKIRRRARFRSNGTRTSDMYQLCAPSDRLRPPAKTARYGLAPQVAYEQPDKMTALEDSRRLDSTGLPDQNCASPPDNLSRDPSDPIRQGFTRERAHTSTHKPESLKTKFPKDFKPSDEDCEFALNLGHNPLKLFEKFRKYSLSKGSVNEDWHSAFQLFVIRERGDGSEGIADRPAEWRGSGTCSHKSCDGLRTCRYVPADATVQQSKSIAVLPLSEEVEVQNERDEKRTAIGDSDQGRGIKSLRSAER
jgi:hypothetical protein